MAQATHQPTSTSTTPQTPGGASKPAWSQPPTFERDGMVTDQQVASHGFEAVSAALVMLARLKELQPGDRLTVERNEEAPPSQAREA
jgi:hypothetical protein